MRFREYVRVENSPALNREEFGKLIRIRGRVSFMTKKPYQSYDIKQKKVDKIRFSSLFVDFIAFKREDGSEPGWVQYIAPGARLIITGQIFSNYAAPKTPGDKPKSFTNIEVQDIEFPMRDEDESTSAPAKQTPPTSRIPVAATVSSTEDEVIPF
jgi:hypothetical protein